MNAADQQAILAAFRSIGLTVERPTMIAGSRRGIEPVSLESLVGDWMRRGYIVTVDGMRTGRADVSTFARVLLQLHTADPPLGTGSLST